MSNDTRLTWLRIILAAIGSVSLPILILVIVLFIYGHARLADSPSPEVFAPIAGAWVGPIGSFICTFILARWAAKYSADRPITHGLAVGLFAVLFDYLLGNLLDAPVQVLTLLCYSGMLLAGLIGGVLSQTHMHLHRRISIQCKPTALWRCLTDTSLLKQWISTLVDETLDDPAITTLGAWSTIHIREGKKIVAYRSVVTIWEPEHRLAIWMSCGSFPPGMEMEILYELSIGEDSMTTLDYDVRAKLNGIMSKLMGPIMCLVGASNATNDLAKLKVLASSILN